MVRKMQNRFIVSAAIAVLIVLGSVIAVINGVMRGMAIWQNTQILDELLDAQEEDAGNETRGGQFSGSGLQTNHYFLVRLNAAGEVVSMDLSHEVMLDEEEARDLAVQALSTMGSSGNLQHDRILFSWKQRTYEADSTTAIAFLNTTALQNTIRQLLRLSVSIGLLAWAGFLFLFVAFSSRAVRPLVKNMEAQKRFITNASHELKTPVAIISANTELLEAMNGENEWTKSTISQTERLTGLINELVTLSRVSELEKLDLQDIDFSAVTEQAARDILPVVTRQGKELETKIAENVHVAGDLRFLQMLVNIFLDNAAKYCDEQGMIRVALHGRMRENGAVLTISNDYAAGIDVDYRRFFERFYQQDESHSGEKGKGGFGIGLSTAQEIVSMHRGSIRTDYAQGRISFKITLPGAKKVRKAAETAASANADTDSADNRK